MGNVKSRHSATRARNQENEYFDFLRLPSEIQTHVASFMCPHCSIEDGAIPSTDEARELQRDLGNLAVCSKHLLTVANGHRFHSFIMACDPNFADRHLWSGDPVRVRDVDLAYRYHNSALPELLERLINYRQLHAHLKFLSIRNFTLRFKAGITKRRLRLFRRVSRALEIPVPDFVKDLLNLPDHTTDRPPSIFEQDPFWLEGELWILEDPLQAEENCTKFDVWLIRLLLVGLAPNLQRLMMDPIIAQRVFNLQDHAIANLPSVRTLGIPESTGDILFVNIAPRLQMENLILNFPNLSGFQNDERKLSWSLFRRIPAGSPPSYPNLRKLVLMAEQPGRLHHFSRVLHEFPCLEELYFHRRRSDYTGANVPDFPNAKMFDAVHHCLRKLTYTSTLITQHPDPDDFVVEIESLTERRFLDVPHFGAFTMLEHLTIDQGLLGRMSTIRDCLEAPIGPHLPDLDFRLPDSLRRLNIRFVYDWHTLAGQLIPLAIAKGRGTQFPFLSDIFIVVVQGCTVEYTGTWPPQIPLPPNQDQTVVTGNLLKETGINFWISTEEIGPPPVELLDYARDVETLIAIIVRRGYFHEV